MPLLMPQGGAFFPNLLFLYRKTVNISLNLAFGRREKNLGVQKASGGAKLTFGGGKTILGVQ